MVKSASAPPITQPPILSTPLWRVAPVLSSAMNVQVINAVWIPDQSIAIINDVTEHRCESDFEREMHMRGIGERVRHK